MSAFRDHFSHDSAGYAAHRPGYPAALFAWLADRVDVRETAWDCATGSGQAAVGLAAHFERVVATDASAQQVASAVPHPRVEYRVAPAEASGLPAASVDLVTVAQAAHWFDLPRFYAEAQRVLKPGGLLAIWCYERLSIEPGPDAVIEPFYAGVLADYWPPERRHVETGYRDLPFPFAELPIPALAMTADWRLDQLMGYLATWSAVKRYREATGHDPLPELEARLREVWFFPDSPKRIRWPLVLRLGRVAPYRPPPARTARPPR